MVNDNSTVQVSDRKHKSLAYLAAGAFLLLINTKGFWSLAHIIGIIFIAIAMIFVLPDDISKLRKISEYIDKLFSDLMFWITIPIVFVGLVDRYGGNSISVWIFISWLFLFFLTYMYKLYKLYREVKKEIQSLQRILGVAGLMLSLVGVDIKLLKVHGLGEYDLWIGLGVVALAIAFLLHIRTHFVKASTEPDNPEPPKKSSP